MIHSVEIGDGTVFRCDFNGVGVAIATGVMGLEISEHEVEIVVPKATEVRVDVTDKGVG